MRKTGRDNRPHIKPVTRIELSEKNTKLRWIMIVVLLSIGVVAILIGLMSVLNTEPGWQQVEVSSNQPNCSGDFVLMYDFSDAGSSATAQYKRLTSLYTESSEHAFRVFSPNVLEDGLGNVAYLNAHINETVTVEEELYQALELVAGYGDRHVFLAPATVEYNRVFLAESDEEAAAYDPARNGDTAAWLEELARFVRDPEAISLELLGENRVRLNVSDAYLHFVQEWEIETLLDFGWMTNAFIADYLADVLTDNGFTCGYLSSYDGFTRNLDDRGQTYLLNIFDKQGTKMDIPARMHYTAPASIVFLRNYPMAEEDRWHYYAYGSGETVTAFLDPADCMSKSAADNLVSYSNGMGCAEILLQTASVFIADDFRTETLNTLAQSGLYSIWCDGKVLKYNDSALTLELVEDSQYSLSLEGET